MITDAAIHLPGVLEADVCIAGAGPAGMVLALELASRGHAVLLLEGGGLDHSGPGSDIYAGEVSGRPYPLAASRLRWFGGSSNHWGGWCRPLDAVDFVAKPGQVLPAWPMKRDELEPWYRQAAQWCEIDATEYEPGKVGLPAPDVLAFEPADGFINRLFRFSPPTRFGTRYREEVRKAANLDCWVNLNLTALEFGDGHVRQGRARVLGGGECVIRARHFAVAMGGLENARFLLNQAPVPGNQSGLVGACFMDHFGYSPGDLLAQEDLRYHRFNVGDAPLMPVISPSESLILAEGLPNACLTLDAGVPDKHLPPEYLANDVLGTASGSKGYGRYAVTMIIEPTPRPDSRITLGDERDALGLRTLHLHWDLPAAEFERARRLTGRLVQALGASGRGRLRWVKRETPAPDYLPGVGFHHMGTTRMSADPAWGVVDPECRVWGVENLYVAGSSVFATAGFSNPTLTIVALAARLASTIDRNFG